MRGILYYFSGTGNTKWAAENIKKRLEFYGNIVKLINIEHLEEVVLEECEFIIIGSPVYAEVAPKIVMNFINKLPEGRKDIRCMLYCTLSAKSAAALDIMRNILQKKGYKVEVQAFVQLPNNYHFGVGKEQGEDKIKKLFHNADIQIKKTVEDFLKNNSKMETASRVRVAYGKLQGSWFYKFLPRISKALTAVEQCNKCGLCLRNCPKGNITFEEGKAVFHSNCIMCARCIHICPLNAVRYNGKKVNQTQKHIINLLDIR